MVLFAIKKESRKCKIEVFGLKISFIIPFTGNNKIIIVKRNGKEKRVPFIFGVRTKFLGSNAIFKLYEPIASFKNCEFIFGDESLISIDSSEDNIKNLKVMSEAKGQKLLIGKDFGILSGLFRFHKKENCTIKIGDDCIFSEGIIIRTCDGHKIRDINTKEIINDDKDVIIGNHVWLGQKVILLKGSQVPDNTIVAYGTTVTKNFEEENTILAGTPAKVVKHNVNWERN